MTKDLIIIFVAFFLIPFIVLFPFVIISQRGIKKRLDRDPEFKEEYKFNVIFSAMGFIIPASIFIFLTSIIGFAQLNQSLNLFVPSIFPKIGLSFSIFLFVFSLSFFLYAYLVIRKNINDRRIILWILVSMFIYLAIDLFVEWVFRRF